MPTFYIDPTAPVNGTGTTTSDPFNVWPALNGSNVYLQKRGTTANTQAAPLTAFGRSDISLGAYGVGPNPVVNGGTAIGLQCSNSSNVAIEGIDFVSTGSYGVVWVGGSGFALTDTTIIGTRAGLSITTSSSSNANNITLTRVTAQHTSAVNEQSGLFIAAQHATYGLTNVRIINCNFVNSARIGAQIKSGDANVSSRVNGLLISGCNISNNGSGGLLINTGATTFAEDKFATNVVVENNIIASNRFEGAVLSMRGGYNRVCYNTVTGNQKFSDTNLSASGGLSVSASTNVDVYSNIARDNGSGGRAYDGIGIYLDVIAFLPSLGTNNSRVFNNVSIANAEYAPDAGPGIASSMLSSGIGVYKSYNNIITGNVCIANGAGICIGAWTHSNRIYNNTLIGNKYGIAQLWNATLPGNTIRNNIVKDSTSHAFAAPSTFNFATTGNITLSGTTGTVTCTSTQNDFTTVDFNYAVIAGGGVGWVVSKQSNTQITIAVISTFSGTTFTNGNWSIGAGQDQGVWPGYSALFNNAAGAYAGSGQSLTVGSNNVTADPQVLSDGSIRTNSPCATTGIYAQGIPLANGRLRPGYVPIGAYMAVQPRAPRI